MTGCCCPLTTRSGPTEARIHALFTALFPSDVLSNVFGDGLATLTDGQLLCEAFNAMVRRSSQPFPLIPLDRIHDILGEAEQKESPSRQIARETSSQPRHQRSPGRNESADGSEAAGRRRRTYLFRRIENLREFAAVRLSDVSQLRPTDTSDVYSFNDRP